MLKQLSLELKRSTVVSLPNMKYEVQRCMKKKNPGCGIQHVCVHRRLSGHVKWLPD